MSEFSMAELRDMAPAYVLGALSPEETAAFERALGTSKELAAEVEAYNAVVAKIGSASEIAPPPALRARFLDKIAVQASNVSSQNGSAALPPKSTTAPAASHPASAPALTVSRGGAPNTPRSEPKPQSGHNWLTGIFAAGLAASLIFAVQRNSQVSTLNTELAQRDSILAARTVQLAQADSTLNTILEADRNLVMVNLVQAPDSGPTMRFFWNVKQQRGVLHTAGLRPAESGRVYQMWLIKDGKPVPSRTFNTGADGKGLEVNIELPTNTVGVTAVAITVEPTGGSPQPTTTPFLIGEIPKTAQQ